MKKRKIRVRKHWRRKPSGGNTIVKTHLRSSSSRKKLKKTERIIDDDHSKIETRYYLPKLPRECYVCGKPYEAREFILFKQVDDKGRLIGLCKKCKSEIDGK